MTDLGWLDTNLFIHALFPRDQHYPRCTEILGALDDGRAIGTLSPMVVHELTYVLLRLPAFTSRGDVYRYVHSLLRSEGIQMDDRDVVMDALAIWEGSTIGFVDAWLTATALRTGRAVCSVNERDFPGIANSY